MATELNKEEKKNKKKLRPKSKGRKIFDIVSTIVEALIFILVVIAVIFVGVQRRSGKDINLFGNSFYRVLTQSMEPTIHVGDVIMSKNYDGSGDLHEGDIITFIAPSGDLKGRNITHRIEKINTNQDGLITGIITKGDNPSATIDPWTLTEKDVKAVFVRKINILTFMLSGFWGYFVCIILPLIVIFGLFIAGIVMDKIREGKEEEMVLTEEQKKQLAEEYLQKLEENNSTLPGDINPNEMSGQDRDMFELEEFERAAHEMENASEVKTVSKEEMEKQAKIQQRISDVVNAQSGSTIETKEIEEEKVVHVVAPFKLKPVENSIDVSKIPPSSPNLDYDIDYADREESDIGGFQD